MQPKLLLDANLLLLLLVGTFDPRLLTSFKRVSTFTDGDLRLLISFAAAHRIVTTPHVLTEVSNLANALPLKTRTAWFRHFGLFAERFEEIYMPLVTLAGSPIFVGFGITDAAISMLGPEVALVTEDGRLRSFLAQTGLTTYNLRDIRAGQIAASIRFR